MRYSPERFSRYARELQRALIETSMDLPSDWIRNGAKVTDAANTYPQQVSTDRLNTVAQTPIPPAPVLIEPKVEILPPKAEPLKKNITGATFLAGLFRQRIADTRATLAKAGEDLNAAVTDLEDTATHAVNQVKAVKAETADLKAALGLNSNGDTE